MSIGNRLAALERSSGDGRCPECKPYLVILSKGEKAPLCPRCGRPQDAIVIEEVVVTAADLRRKDQGEGP